MKKNKKSAMCKLINTYIDTINKSKHILGEQDEKDPQDQDFELTLYYINELYHAFSFIVGRYEQAKKELDMIKDVANRSNLQKKPD